MRQQWHESTGLTPSNWTSIGGSSSSSGSGMNKKGSDDNGGDPLGMDGSMGDATPNEQCTICNQVAGKQFRCRPRAVPGCSVKPGRYMLCEACVQKHDHRDEAYALGLGAGGDMKQIEPVVSHGGDEAGEQHGKGIALTPTCTSSVKKCKGKYRITMKGAACHGKACCGGII